MNYSDTYTGQRWTYGSKFRPFLSLFGYFVGQVMKRTQGKANTRIFQRAARCKHRSQSHRRRRNGGT